MLWIDIGNMSITHTELIDVNLRSGRTEVTNPQAVLLTAKRIGIPHNIRLATLSTVGHTIFQLSTEYGDDVVWVVHSPAHSDPSILAQRRVTVSLLLEPPVTVILPKKRPLILVASELPWTFHGDQLDVQGINSSDTEVSVNGVDLNILVGPYAYLYRVHEREA